MRCEVCDSVTLREPVRGMMAISRVKMRPVDSQFQLPLASRELRGSGPGGSVDRWAVCQENIRHYRQVAVLGIYLSLASHRGTTNHHNTQLLISYLSKIFHHQAVRPSSGGREIFIEVT